MKEMVSFLADKGLTKRIKWACSVTGTSRSALIREGVNWVTEHYLEDKGKELSVDEKLDKILRRLESS